MAGSLSLEAGLKLVAKRGELMGEHGEGGMMALTLDVETARILADKHYCQVASCNLPAQTVVGGREEDLEALAADIARELSTHAGRTPGDRGRVSYLFHGYGRAIIPGRAR